MISINTNIVDSMLHRGLSSSSKTLSISMQRLSSGCKINNAADDAAGLSLSTKTSSRIKGLSKAKMNIQTGINLLNIADDSLSGMLSSAQRIRDLALQAANGVYSAQEKQAIQNEINQLTQEIKQAKDSAKFNEMNIFSDASTAGASTRAASAKASSTTSHKSKAEALANGYTVIESAQDFVNLISDDGSNTQGKTFILMGDIDMSSFGYYTPKRNFEGTLDGNGYTISNFTYNSRSQDMALFQSVDMLGMIINLNLDNITNITNDSSTVAGLVCNNNGTLENCSITNSTISGSNSGGLVGSNNGIIRNCSVSATIENGENIGGIAGTNNREIIQSFFSGIVRGGNITGGLVGTNAGTIEESFSAGTVQGSQENGGIAGRMSGGDIRNSYSTANIFGGNLTAHNVGGIVGRFENGTLFNVFYSGDISYGGALGYAGAIIGETTGGLPNLINCYWNTDKNVPSYAVDGYGLPPGSATGLTDSAMNDPSMFVGWDNNVWDFNVGQPPKLKWETVPTPTPPPTPPPPSSGNIQLQIEDKNNDASVISIDTVFDFGTLSFNVMSDTNARNAIKAVDELIEKITSKQSEFGANINRLSSIADTHDLKIENLTQANSTITDTNIASETSKLVKSSILEQANASLYSQSAEINASLILGLINNKIK